MNSHEDGTPVGDDGQEQTSANGAASDGTCGDGPFGNGRFGQEPVGNGLALIPLETLSQAAECLKVMAHPLRLHIVDILMQAEMPVNRLAQLCDLPPHQACEHLRLLKGHGLLDSVRRGRTVYYRIADPRLPGLLNCIRNCCGLALPNGKPPGLPPAGPGGRAPNEVTGYHNEESTN